jgi:autotransporter-associated beta strand protein
MKLQLQKNHFVKKRMLPILMWCMLLFGVQSDLWGQVWTYDFGTTTGTITSGANTAFFPSPPSGGGTYRVRIGSAGGGVTLANPGTSLGSATEAQITAATSTSSNKVGVYDWTTPTTVGYLKANIRTTSTAAGNLNISFGVNTVANDNQGYTSHYNNSLASLRMVYSAGALTTVSRRSSGADNAITGSGLAKDTDNLIEIYANNASTSTNYSKGAGSYTLNAQSWDLWVGGTKISPANGWAKAGTGAANLNLSGFCFFAESSAGNAAVFYIDDIEYSNTLPTVSTPTVSTTAAASVTTTGASLGGDVTATGGGTISATGIVYSLTATNSNPLLAGAGVTNLATAAPNAGTGTFTETASGLAVNTRYSHKAYATNSAGTAYGTVATFYTLANTPDVPAVGSPTASSLLVSIPSLAGNPASTEYAIEVDASGNYVQADGTATGAAVWQTASAWGAITVTGLTAETLYSFRLYARNGDNVITAPGDPSTGTTLSASQPSLTLGTLADFGTVCTNSFATASFTLNGSNLNGTDIEVSSAFGELTFSDTQNGTYNSVYNISYIGNSVSTTVWVKFTPSFAGLYAGDIDITGAGLSPAYVITANGNGVDPVTPSVTTGSVSAVANTIATISGTVNALGVCLNSVEKGFVYADSALNSDPIAGDANVTTAPVAGLTEGSYALALTALNPNTTYYYKAYLYDGTDYTYGAIEQFTTLAVADHLFFSVDPPATGSVGINLASFTVQARRPDNSVDTEYTTAITIDKVTGPGNLTGTATTVNGVATFTTAKFDAVGTYTISASSGSLATVINPVNIVITIPNAPAVGWSGAASCAGGTSQTWLTAANWCGGVIPSATTVAQFNALGTATIIGFNMNGASIAQKTLGAIEMTAGNARTIGNSSGGTAGDFTLNGVVINSVPNTVVRNAGPNLLTIRKDQVPANPLGLVLGNATNNIVNTDGAGGITITANISGTGRNLTKTGTGGALTLSGANTYTGTTTVEAGTLTLGGANALPVTASAGDVRFTAGTPVLNLGSFNLGTSTAAANSAGQLDFDVNTTVNLGTGNISYYFKGSSAQTWDATAITISNWVGNAGFGATGSNPKIFIGASDADLTPTQLAKIQFTGFSTGATQLITGEIVPILLPPVLDSFPATACVGTSIVINGVNVGNASSVTIGADVATILTNTNSAITVTVPAGAGGVVSVTTPGGTATSTESMVINPMPTASISGTATLCEGAGSPVITFTGANGTAPYTFIYRINSGADTTVTTVSGDSVTIEVDTNLPGVYDYALVSVQDSSSSFCSNPQSGSAVVTVNTNVTYYADTDEDTFGDLNNPIVSCFGAPEGYVANSTDCDDTDGTIYQSGFFSIDSDADGYDAGQATVCYGASIPAGYSLTSNGTDCNDNDNTVWQSALLFIDADGDGWDAGQATVCYGAAVPTGYSLTSDGTDCDDTNPTLTNNCPTIVNLTMFIEGYYIGANTMNSVKLNQDLVSPADEVEDVTVSLHDATTYALVANTTATLYTDGTLSASFDTAPTGSFYIVLLGRNFVQTWSATPQTVGTTPLTYDFTTSASQAYGDNMKEVETGVFAFYSGDINQDNAVNGPDYTDLVTDIENTNFGELATDLNGDGVVDGSDTTTYINNTENAILASYPF